jgi:hypothetical protein
MKILIAMSILLIVFISGCVQECEECPRTVCPEITVNRQTLDIPGYLSQDVSFTYDHNASFQKCIDQGQTGDECFGFNAAFCYPEFERQLNIIPDYCLPLYDMGDMRAGGGNVACRCWYEVPE